MSHCLALFRGFDAASRWQLALIVAGMAMLELASVWAIYTLLLLLFALGSEGAPASLPAWMLRDLGGALPSFGLSAAAILAFFLVKNLMLSLLWWRILLCLGIEQHRFTVSLFGQYLRAPYVRHVDQSKMDLQQNLNVVASQIFIFSVFPFILMAVEVVTAAGVVVYLMLVSPLITLVLTLWVAVALVVFRIVVTKTAESAGAAQRHSLKRMLSVSQETFTDIKSIKLWRREAFFAALFGNAAQTFSWAWTHARFLQQLPRFALEPILVGSLTVFGAVLSFQHMSQQALFLQLSIFAAGGMRLLPAANRMVGLMQTVAFHKADMEAVLADSVLSAEDADERSLGTLPAPFERDVTVQNVVAGYNDGQNQILSNVTLTLRRGEKVALVGKSGSGKTTLINVLLGFVPVRSGAILFDGIGDHPLRRFRSSAVAFVPQTICLLEESIAANIVFGAEEKNEDRIWECLSVVGFDAHVRGLSNGLLTRIGDDGAKLSGGERQRLALARALYQRPDFLVLDEATSQLDFEAEAAVMACLFEAYPDLTVLMATHRIETIKSFDMCIRMEAGRIVRLEHAPHEDKPYRGQAMSSTS